MIAPASRTLPPPADANDSNPGLSASSRKISAPQTVLNACSSIWFGVTLLVLIFIYSSIGSAVPPIRQGVMADWLGLEFLRFEKTEMEWFAWWPFTLMVTLFCIALVLATLRRIRLSVVNLGVWSIHAGIIIMCVSSFIYFYRKVEGDAAIFQARAVFTVPGMEQPASMVVRPQAVTDFGIADRYYRVSVANIVPGYEILTGTHKGRKTQAIWFNVQSINPERSFIRLMLLGYPEYTEDVVQKGGASERAVKMLGRPLLDEELDIHLTYDAVDRFHVMDTGAIYARFSPTEEWRQLRLRRVPRYFEHISRRDGLLLSTGERMPPLRPLDLPAKPVSERDRLEDIDLRVTDFLPYAQLEAPHASASHAHHAGCDHSGEMRPRIIPRHQRQSLMNVGQGPSLIRVELNDGHGVQSLWLPFNRYALLDDQRSQPNRFAYAPRSVRLADGRTLELMYSRWSEPLPAPVALDRFVLQTYPGGERPSDYISLIRFWEQGRWTPLVEVKSNNPAQHGSLWYFQSQWDPGIEAHTVLGVGNREGVYGMMLGVLLSIAGMIYAFYVKPVVIRRRQLAALAAARPPIREDGDRPAVHLPEREPEAAHV